MPLFSFLKPFLRRAAPGSLLVAFSAVLGAGEASADCRILRYDLLFGQANSHYMSTSRDEPCKVAPTDGWVGRSVPSPIQISSIGIASRAKFGIAGTDGSSFYAYKPNPGFVGKDEFVVTLIGSSGTTRGTATVRVQVTVGP